MLHWVAPNLRVAVAAAVLLVSSAASAVTIDFFHSASDDGLASKTDTISLTGAVTVNLWVDPTGAPGGGVIDITDVVIATSGAVTITTFTCDSTLCLAGNPIPGRDASNHLRFTYGNAQAVNSSPFQVGTIVVNVSGAGSLLFEAGDFFAADFSFGALQAPEQVVAFPEPTLAVLLVAALGAVGWRTRRAD